jgi:metal-dependent amidase/aminoacylase/carboxypeptidase family protein
VTTGSADHPEAPHTGDDAVDAAVQLLAGVCDRPLDDQLAVYDAVHRTLQDRLADVEG